MLEDGAEKRSAESEMTVPSTSSGTTFKRKRLHGACDACRRKKSDSAIQPDNICSNCINSKFQCTHETNRRKKRPEVVQQSNLHLQVLEDRLKTMEAYLRSAGLPRLAGSHLDGGMPSMVPQPSFPSTSSMSGLATNAAAFQLEGRDMQGPPSNTSFIHSAAGTITSTNPLRTPDEVSDDEVDDLSHVTLAEGLKNLSLDITENRYFGRSSMFLYAQNCMRFKNEQIGDQDGTFARTQRPIFWELREWEKEYLRARKSDYTFPEPDLLDSLISLYFDNVHILLPVLHRPTFEREVRLNLHLHDASFAATVLIVCAIASRYSSDPRVNLEGDDSSAGWKYISQIPLTSSRSLVQTNLYDLQRNALAALYFQGTSMNHTSWTLAGIGLRLAQDSGLHRRQRARSKPTKDSELKQRAFWCLVAMDRSMSSLLGRPCALYGEDIDVDYPIECDDQYWDTEDPDQAFKQPAGRPSLMAGFIAYLRLCDIIGSMLRTLYSTKKCRIIHGLAGENWQMRIINELDIGLVAWKEALPPHLHWDPHTTHRYFFNQALFLHSAFFYVRIQIHRPILTKDSLHMSSSFVLCREEARHCSRTLHAATSRGGVANANIMMSAFASALTLVVYLWAKREFVTPDEVNADNACIEHCLSYIRRSENRWHGAARMIDMITEFRTVRNVRVQGDPVETPQSVPFSPTGPCLPHPSSGYSSPTSPADDVTLANSNTSFSAFSTPSPLTNIVQDQQQATATASLNLAELPADTPFNFDFSHLQSGSGSGLLSHYGHVTSPDMLFSNNAGGGLMTGDAGYLTSSSSSEGIGTFWSQAPVAYSIEEWDRYIATLEKVPPQ